MRILTRNTVFKTAVLTGLFSCLLALAGAFFGTTAPVHAMHGFTHADEVSTDQDKLKEFVKDAVDAYYIDFIIKACDFSDAPFAAAIAAAGVDLATATVDVIKGFIPFFPAVGIRSRSDIDPYCDFTQRFDQVFDKEGNREEGDWKSGSIYLFVMDDQGKMLFHGDDPEVEGIVLAAEDEGGRDVPQLIIDEAETPSNNGIVEYCWENPDVDDDEILENGNPIEGKAPGDSWKIGYVVDPFVLLGAPALSGSPKVIFASGIYPETGEAPSGCDGNGMADYDGDDMDGDGDDMDGDGDDMDGDGDDMDGDGDDMDGDGDDIVDTVKDIADSGGCTIAAGSDSTPQGTAFNLLLIVSALFLAVSFGNRAVGRRNGIRS